MLYPAPARPTANAERATQPGNAPAARRKYHAMTDDAYRVHAARYSCHVTSACVVLYGGVSPVRDPLRDVCSV